jgi:hypothetical protein
LVISALLILNYWHSLFFGSVGLPGGVGRMTSKSDSLYYAERLAAELKAFEAATNDVAKNAHQKLAEHYAQMLAVVDPAPPPAAASEVN